VIKRKSLSLSLALKGAPSLVGFVLSPRHGDEVGVDGGQVVHGVDVQHVPQTQQIDVGGSNLVQRLKGNKIEVRGIKSL